MGVDVGRFGCSTEVCIIKVTPSTAGMMIKRLVNIYSFNEEHFGMQAIRIKRLFNLYKCHIAVIDGNGLGAGLVDMLTMDTTDPDSGEILFNCISVPCLYPSVKYPIFPQYIFNFLKGL